MKVSNIQLLKNFGLYAVAGAAGFGIMEGMAVIANSYASRRECLPLSVPPTKDSAFTISSDAISDFTQSNRPNKGS